MKLVIKSTMVALTAALLSFSNYGGEGFEISLNNKVVIQKYGQTMNTVQSLRLSQNSSNDQLTIRYHHCGKVGKNRIITIRNGQNKVVKEWRYSDVSTQVGAMNCDVKDIINLRKGNESTFKLYYSSSELPNGRLLTSIVVESTSVAGTK